MKFILVQILCAFTILGCMNTELCDKNKYRVFEVKFPSIFPFGRHQFFDSLELRIGNKTISYENRSELICLENSDKPDTIFCCKKGKKPFWFILAKFKNSEVYSVQYNQCEDQFQLHPKIDTDLILEYRLKVINLPKGDTIEVSALYGDNFFVTDSTKTNWGKIGLSANCNNSFKYISIDKAYGVKKRCEENDSSWCYMEADSNLNLEQITFQQLHNERLDIEYNCANRHLDIKIH